MVFIIKNKYWVVMTAIAFIFYWMAGMLVINAGLPTGDVVVVFTALWGAIWIMTRREKKRGSDEKPH